MRPQSLVTVGLCVVTLASLGIAAWEYHTVAALRAEAGPDGGPAQWEQRVKELTDRNRALEARLAQLKKGKTGGKDGATAMAAGATGPAGSTVHLRENRGQEILDLFSAMADVPEFQKLVALEQRGAIESRYAALFHRLHLQPEQQQALETLLADKQSAWADALLAAHDQGLTGRDAILAARTVAEATRQNIDDSIKSMLGDQDYRQYQNYEHTLPQRETVNQLAQRLSYTNAPLTPKEQERLVQTLAVGTRQELAAAKAQAAATGQKMIRPPLVMNAVPNALARFGIPSPGGAVITPNAVAGASKFLAPSQVSALEQLQQEQQAQLQLGNLLRTSFGKAPKTLPPVPPSPVVPGGHH